jgi:hypothetical protein
MMKMKNRSAMPRRNNHSIGKKIYIENCTYIVHYEIIGETLTEEIRQQIIAMCEEWA